MFDDESALVLVADDNDRNADFGYPGFVDYAVTNVSSLTEAAQGGDTFTYEVIVSNVGERDGTGVVVVDTVPMDIFLQSGLEHDQGGDATWDFGAGTLTWDVGDLDVGSLAR